MPTPIRQEDMEAIFAVTDELGIHRESITVPLGRRDPGGVRDLGRGNVEITAPEGQDVSAWAQGAMREQLAALGYEELP